VEGVAAVAEPMRRTAVVLISLALVAAACGDDTGGLFTTTTTGPSATTVTTPGTTTGTTSGAIDEYPEAIVDAYMEGCSAESGAPFCQCTIEEFEARLTLGEFLNLDTDALESDPVAMDVIGICLRLLDDQGGTTVAGGTTTLPEFTPITDIEDIIDISITDLEEYWAEELPATFGVEYQSPTFIGPYFISEGDVPECGGPLDPSSYEQNAFYCSIDDSVQWDHETLMTPLFEEFGDFTVALVLAHEWGHAIQERFGFDDFNNPTIVSELQADCLAGAWTGRVAREESDNIRLEPGDLEEAMAGFLLIGDSLGSAPGGPNAHGGSFDRLNAFFEGYNSGAGQCATYEDTPPQVIFIPLVEGDDPVEGGDLPLADAGPLLADALEVFWSLVYPDFFGEEWVPLGGIVPYRPSTGNFPACGGFTESADFYPGNVFYCQADDYIAWDDEVLFPSLYSEIGDFAIGLVLANEYGRAVQTRLGLPIEGVEAQLQTDCMAGVWTAALLPIDENPMGIYLSAGDLEEGIAGFLQLSANPGAEGAATAFDRFEAFKDGFFDGLTVCGLG
jgi:predicted metalloprotease